MKTQKKKQNKKKLLIKYILYSFITILLYDVIFAYYILKNFMN